MVERANHTIEKLYGTEHGFAINIAGAFSLEYPVSPSTGLLEELLGLPQNTLVGLETCDPQEIRRLGKKVSGQPIYFNEADNHYWDLLTRCCRGLRLPIVYLDSFQLHKDVAAKVIEANDIRNQAVVNLAELDLESTPDQEIKSQERAFNELLYRKWVEAKYIHVVEREEEIVKRMARFKPMVAIVGSGHGDYWRFDDSLLFKYGIAVNSYKREEFENENLNVMMFRYESHLFSDYLRPVDKPPLNNDVVIERRCLERQYNAITLGRILPEGKPDYIGTWDLTSPSRGLFEIYIGQQTKNQPFSGIIEDSIGTADFVGDIQGNSVFFLKRYNLTQCLTKAPHSPIWYWGYFNQGKCQGTFSFHSRCGTHHDFLMLPGDKFTFE